MNCLLNKRKKGYSISILSILLLLCQNLSIYANAPKLSINYFSQEDGILNSNINDVSQDTTGFIWVATQNGLYKYDGYHFNSYLSENDDSCSLPSNQINKLLVDSNGILWVATTNGLCQYNQEQDNFNRFRPLNKQYHPNGHNVGQIEQGKPGILYVSISPEIYKIDYTKNVVSKILSLNEGQINHFIIENNNTWVACSGNKGLEKYNLYDKKWEKLPGSNENSEKLKKATISKLALDHGRLWMAMLGGGIAWLNIHTGEFKQYSSINQDQAMAVDIYIDRDHHIWSIDYTGLKFLDPQTGKFHAYYPNIYDPNSIQGAVHGIYQDRQKNFWIYHSPGGVGISMNLKGFNSNFEGLESYTNDPTTNVLSIAKDSNNKLWIGKAEGGIYVIDRKSKTSKYYSHSDSPHSLGHGAVMTIFRDSKGKMWVGTYFNGLQYFDEKKQQFFEYKPSASDPNSIAGNDVRSIAEDQKGNLWLAVHGKGVDFFDQKKQRFIHYNNQHNNLSNDWTNQVLIDHKGDLWVATVWGLSRLRNGKHTFENYYSQPGDTSTLNDNVIKTIFEDNNDVLWIGTPTGLNRYNPEKNNFTQFNNLFSNNNIQGILSGSKNRLWISNQYGLSMFDPTNHTVINFTKDDGLHSYEYNTTTCYKSTNNVLYFGGTRGMDVFKPEDLHFNTKPPKVFIDQLKISNKKLTKTQEKEKLQQVDGQPEKLILDDDDNVISISYKALNFINSKKNQYAYKLVDFDEDWNYVGTKREATYTNLHPGEYLFRVIASNNDGVWNHKGTQLKIVVLPPWYKTNVFKSIVILAIIFAIWGYNYFRTVQFNKQKSKLEEAVKEKTAALSEKNNLLELQTESLNKANQLLIERKNQLEIQSKNLSQANQELSKLNTTKDKLFSIIAHDLSGPFNSIVGFSDILNSQSDQLTNNEKSEFADHIHKSSKQVFELLQNLLAWARTQTKHISCHPTSLKIKDHITRIAELNSGQLKAKSLDLSIDCQDETRLWGDQEMIHTILRNLINNAIKFSNPGGTIQIKVLDESDYVKIIISDNGVGMSQTKIDEILSSKVIVSEKGTHEENGSGLGIMICKEFIDLNNGKLGITSLEGQGTSITISFPRENDTSQA
ncbi:MAG TPA: two-component regulator propeller domain-containing protein [Sunxiuqinia sp.]|nr:two-component regulator propeller domain-containing protein [Sunxiuqinia sp.]